MTQDKQIINFPEIKLLGISVRTNNANEVNPSTAQIGKTIGEYTNSKHYEKISNRKNPGVTYCAYTNYESDMNGDYDYFIGEEVTEINTTAKELISLIVPAQRYIRFTSEVGAMPNVCINLWQKIWQMESSGIITGRSYLTDFELYDARARDPNNTLLEIYIGIKP